MGVSLRGSITALRTIREVDASAMMQTVKASLAADLLSLPMSDCLDRIRAMVAQFLTEVAVLLRAQDLHPCFTALAHLPLEHIATLD